MFRRRRSETTRPAAGLDRADWADIAFALARPVCAAFGAGRLRELMPAFSAPGREARAREVAPLEAVGRVYCGVAGWLSLSTAPASETGRIEELAGNLAEGFERSAVELQLSSALPQSLVDIALLAQGHLSGADRVWPRLSDRARSHVVDIAISTRAHAAPQNNWLLFAAMRELFIQRQCGAGDFAPVSMAVHRLSEWYAGDGWYKDGDSFALDYYNSFVIHPMLYDILRLSPDLFAGQALPIALETQRLRMMRHAQAVERMIGPRGYIPPVGRSICYRTGALHVLAKCAAVGAYPAGLGPGRVRAVMSEVICRFFSSGANVDEGGWLVPGFAGRQPQLCESYITTGSHYLALAAFLPLGLPADDPFWTAPPEEPTARMLAAPGSPLGIDAALKG